MKPYAIGIDVGGTKLAAGLVDQDGQILARHVAHGHAQQQPGIVIAAIVEAYRSLIQRSAVAENDIEAVGLGFPGNTDGAAGVVLASSNLPDWDHFPLRKEVAKQIGMPVVLDNDANLCAVGEHRFGAGRGTRHMCYVTFSTGYGIGIIIDGRLYAGHTGTAGELGHVVIDIDGPPCTCGKRGCVMAYASGIGMSRMAYEQIESGAGTVLGELASTDGRRITGQEIAEAASQGDRVASEIVATAAYYGGVGLSMIVEILNPQRIVVGGGLTRIGPRIVDPMIVAMRQHTQPELWDSTRVVPWQLGDDIGILGGAAKVFADAEASLPIRREYDE